LRRIFLLVCAGDLEPLRCDSSSCRHCVRCLGELSQLVSQSRELTLSEIMTWTRRPIVIWIVPVIKCVACERARVGIPGNDVQVNVPVLILEKDVVKVIRLKSQIQDMCYLCQLVVQIRPLDRRELWNCFQVTPKHEKTLAQVTLVFVQDEPPASTFCDDWSKICVTKVTFFHHVPRPVSEPS
jgi:hypothetical protein